MVIKMSKWKELVKNHPAIEPKPVSTMEKMHGDADADFQQVAELNVGLSKNEDMVNHPAHYQGEIECIDAIEASMSKEAFAGHCKACAIKYLWRYKDKGGVESLEKAQWYLARLINTEKNAL